MSTIRSSTSLFSWLAWLSNVSFTVAFAGSFFMSALLLLKKPTEVAIFIACVYFTNFVIPFITARAAWFSIDASITDKYSMSHPSCYIHDIDSLQLVPAFRVLYIYFLILDYHALEPYCYLLPSFSVPCKKWSQESERETFYWNSACLEN